MSIEANTYEELTLNNTNEKAKRLAAEIGDYLLKTWGIIRLWLRLDGKEYETETDTVSEQQSELYNVCKSLSQYQKIELALRSVNGGGLIWRTESCFLSNVDNVPELKECFTYKSIDYYDVDEHVDMYKFDSDGSRYPEYTFGGEKDIAGKWFCNNPILTVSGDEDEPNAELHDFIIQKMRTLLSEGCNEIDEDALDDYISDCWESDGVIEILRSISLIGEKAELIRELIQEMADKAASYDGVTFQAELWSVYDDADKDFVSLAIISENGEAKIGYCEY